MSGNEFRSPVAVDSAPAGSHCEWRGKPANYQLMVIGGKQDVFVKSAARNLSEQ